MSRWMAILALPFLGCADGASSGAEQYFADTGQDGGDAAGAQIDGTADGSQTDSSAAPSWWRPALESTWQWQLGGDIDTAVDADIYDIDLFEAPDATLAALHAQGRRVICYFSAGSSEDWRPDFAELPAAALGKPLDGWEGERWLDVRAEGVRAVMRSRLDRAATRGCDGVEPDNVDGWTNDTGFDLTAADQLAFNRWLATESHARGLAVALKNDGAQVGDLVETFDLAVVEQCVELGECSQYAPFPAAGKPVLVAEYRDDAAAAQGARASVCAQAEPGFHILILPLDLDGSFRVSCEE